MGILFPPLNIGAHYDLIALHIQNNLKFSWEEKEETSKAYFSDSLFLCLVHQNLVSSKLLSRLCCKSLTALLKTDKDKS